ncbi:hypothetical protein [Nocardia sp. CA-135398]|uniref:hypothetical protein n=1 Tax=Nocardia sp. CA-135398 TaxID=3239977 RepID=UPI003D99B0DD
MACDGAGTMTGCLAGVLERRGAGIGGLGADFTVISNDRRYDRERGGWGGVARAVSRGRLVGWAGSTRR